MEFQTRFGGEQECLDYLVECRLRMAPFAPWLRGTHRSVSNEHLHVDMDEFIFRYNRRNTAMAEFQRLLGLGTGQSPATYRQIIEQGTESKRATGAKRILTGVLIPLVRKASTSVNTSTRHDTGPPRRTTSSTHNCT